MGDISINSANIESRVSELTRKIQTEIISAGTKSGKAVIDAVENSSGDFIDALKEEVSRETAVINSVGKLLIAMADYVQTAANEFARVDTTYNSLKIK